MLLVLASCVIKTPANFLSKRMFESEIQNQILSKNHESNYFKFAIACIQFWNLKSPKFFFNEGDIFCILSFHFAIIKAQEF